MATGDPKWPQEFPEGSQEFPGGSQAVPSGPARSRVSLRGGHPRAPLGQAPPGSAPQARLGLGAEVTCPKCGPSAVGNP